MVQPINYGGMIAQSMEGLGPALRDAGMERQRRQQQQENKQLLSNAAELYKTGTTEQIAEFSIKNPQIGEILGQQIGYRNERTKQIMADTLGRALTASPEQRREIITQGADAIRAAGGDPQKLITATEDSPEDFERGALMALASTGDHGNPYLSAYKKQPMQRADGALVFDPNTGTYSVDPKAQAYLKKKAEQKVKQAEFKAGKKKALTVNDIKGINSDVSKIIKEPEQIINTTKQLVNIKKTGSAADKLAAVFKFMKTLDPDSAVMEGEQRIARSTGGAFDSMVNKINAAFGEGQISDDVFNQFVNTATTLANTTHESSTTALNEYLDTYGDFLTPKQYKQYTERLPKALDKPTVFDAAPDVETVARQAQTGQEPIEQKQARLKAALSKYGY